MAKVLSQSKTAISKRKFRKENPDKDREYKRRWAKKNREKYLAHKVVENAILSGKLVSKPCEVCGSFDLVHAHHDDYSKPLDVMWLCPTCHKQRHKELKQGLHKISENLPCKPD